MSEFSFVEAFSIPVLSKAIDLLFDQGKKILEERRERRLKGQQFSESDDLPESAFEDLKSEVVITESIHTKEAAKFFKIDSSIWLNVEKEVDSLTSLLDIYYTNYFLAREKHAKWGSSLVPQIIIHELKEAEDQVNQTVKQLEKVLKRVYSESETNYSDFDIEDDSIEKGYLDFAVEGYQAMENIGNSATEISDSTEILGELMNSYTAKLNKLGGATKASQVYQIAAAVARDMNNYASDIRKHNEQLEKDIPLLTESISSLIEWMRQKLDDSNGDEEFLLSYRETMMNFAASVSKANTSIDGFREVVTGLGNQRISRAMNRACMNVSRSLDNTMNTLDSLEDFANSTIELIDNR